ncbi:MAG: hypothetical protein D3924_15940, partial [Candidatus Electrothrix sp. AR4]|nr:hypothetical protein [Candidatus Electrothrix sp. AR4]
VDFSGGSLLQYKADQPFQLDAIRAKEGIDQEGTLIV